MIQKKVCILGGFAVGKTSLVRRFVHSIFSDKYLTTLGVKIDRKVVSTRERELTLMLWDIHGEDEFAGISNTYLRGASGFLLVVDGTRRATLDTAVMLQRRVVETVGDIPFVLLLNKEDLREEWEIDEPAVDKLRQAGWFVRDSSAKTGQGVEEAFLALAEKLSPA